MRNLARPLLLALVVAACSPATGPTPTDPVGSSPTTEETTTTVGPRDCVRVTGNSANVATGSPASDALFLAGELFICADDVVIAPADQINSLAAGAQLAAALQGPLLLPHPQLAAEVGRLKPLHVHIIGDLEVSLPPGIEVSRHSITDAVDTARAALGAVEEIRLPATPDATTIIETVNAIASGDRVVLPQTLPPTATTTAPPPLDPSEIVAGLSVPSEAPKVWLVDAADPVTILAAAGSGHAVDAQIVAYDPADILAHPELGTALAGRTGDTLRFFGEVPESGEWDLAVLLNGRELPGGGFRILGDERPKRYVAFYGHPTTSALGVLGEQGPQATLDRIAPLLPDYEADGYLAIPTFEMMASVASADPSDGDYSAETSIATLQPWVDLAAEQGAYVILDLQSGRDDFLTQAKMYEELLKLPHVGLALDPEWRLKPDQVHLKQIGRVEAAEVNTVVQWLGDLVRDNGLPQKMLIVHQFREFMIQNRDTLEQRPELQMVIQMDGQGPIATKDETWAVLTRGTEDNHWKWGWKNFFDEDTPTPTPEHAIGKVPTPVFVSYQ